MATTSASHPDPALISGRNWYWLGFGALGAAALVIAIMAFVSLRSLDRAKDTVLRENARYVVNSQDAHLLVEKQVASSRGFLITGDSMYLRRWDDSRRLVRAMWDTLDLHAPDPEVRAQLNALREQESRHEDAMRGLIARHGVRPQAGGLMETFRADLQPLRDSVDSMSSAFVHGSMDRLAQAEDKAARTAGLALGAVGITTVFALFLSFLLANRVTRRLTESQRVLQNSQARLDGVVSSAMDAIITADSGHRIVLFNRAAERIFRVPVWEALGQPLSRFIPERYSQDPDRSPAPRWDWGASHRTMGLRAGGEEFPLEATLSRTEVGGETLYTFILRDITERIRAEEALKESESKLRQSQKMEAIGQLAGGVAHDFNNLLTAINGYSELTLSMVEKDGPVYENVAEIRKAGERAATLTSQLLAYSRKQVVTPRVLNLNQVVGNIGKMLQRLIGENMSLITRLEPELDLVKVDAGQVEQVLVNLVLNARDAMPRGGQIEIRTRNGRLAPGQAGMALEGEPGRYVLLEVADRGMGMSPELQSRIFEPFFTTKSVGKGTGLGLSSVYGILKQAGGAMQVSSSPGRGSAFTLYFPALPPDTRVRPELESRPGRSHDGAGETLLLAEDEQAVRHFTRKTLESHGYRVLEAEDGADALRKFQEKRGAISLLVTDMVMPNLNGRDLAQKARDLEPGLRVLYMSGYTDEAVDVGELQANGDAFLAKPFSPDQLLLSVHEILQGKMEPRS